MSFLPTSTDLGNLDVLEIYVQYNGPRLLACKNQAGKIFLGLWVDEEEDSDLWLYMFVSLERLKSVRTGQISLHKAFSTSETHFLYEITYTSANSQWHSKEVNVDQIDKDCLPLENTFLGCDPETLPKLEPQKAIQNAVIKNREIVNLILQPLANYPNEFPAWELGKILSTFQPLINQLIKTTSDLKFRDIPKKSAFNIFATSAGSFQIELASSVFEIGNSLAGDAMQRLFDLIRIGSDADILQKFLLESNKKMVGKYRLFLEAMISSSSGLRIEWGSPTLTRGGSVEANLALISETLEVIKRIESLEIREYEILGELFMADKNSWKFGIKDIRTEVFYRGDILEQAKSDARTATIGKLYMATILETPQMSPTTNIIRNHYKLVVLENYEPSSEQLKLIELP